MRKFMFDPIFHIHFAASNANCMATTVMLVGLLFHTVLSVLVRVMLWTNVRHWKNTGSSRDVIFLDIALGDGVLCMVGRLPKQVSN